MEKMTRTDLVWAAWHYGSYAFPAIEQQGRAYVALSQFRGLRSTSGLRPAQLARRMGVNRATVLRLECTARRDVGIIAMERLANACGFEMRIQFRAVTNDREWIRE